MSDHVNDDDAKAWKAYLHDLRDAIGRHPVFPEEGVTVTTDRLVQLGTLGLVTGMRLATAFDEFEANHVDCARASLNEVARLSDLLGDVWDALDDMVTAAEEDIASQEAKEARRKETLSWIDELEKG